MTGGARTSGNADHAARVLYVDNLISGGSGESLLEVVTGRGRAARSAAVFARRGYLSDAFDAAPFVEKPRYLPLRPWLAWGAADRSPRAALELARGAVRQAGAVARMLRLIRRHRIQLVHTNCVNLIEGALAAKAAGVPHVWQVRELLDLDYYSYAVEKRRFVPWLSRLSDAVLVASERAARGLSWLGAEDRTLRVIPNVVHRSPERSLHALLGLDRAVRLVGIVGWITPNKAVHDFIELASRCADLGAGTRFVVIGGFGHREDYNQSIRRAVDASPNRRNILLTGVVEHAQSTLGSLRALVCPCFTESFGRTVAEALMAGTPAIGIEDTAVAEIVDHGETGFLVARGDVAAMERHVRQLLKDDALHAALSARGQRVALERFAPERVLPQLEALYQELIAGRRR
jgi:glycosyltransferase involved in cell wall biosynthesis